MAHSWHPWRFLRDHLPGVEVAFPSNLRELGRCSPNLIEIDPTSNQAERRSSLTHEMLHLIRGTVHSESPGAQAEELIVEELAARLLITLPSLLRALQWSQDDRELADELWCDVRMVQTRRATLTQCEREWLDARLDDEGVA
ncbi:ImmA/IrrE family metallo-endopeptidase [Rhodococcoides fascians]|uniref:ImmA/IrrE family metallo-endopeptidase n=1 Tax=Rhodococcoides fascians TaxID=1828 RepID=UPI00211B02A6|nr:ImmA/IrrE family metallo-endopeptidase [Rhodococcus fascians]